MINYLIEKYLKNLSYKDYNNYLISKNIFIEDKTNHYFFDLLKDNYKDMIDNPNKYLDIVKDKVDYNTYNEIYELYLTYSKRQYH